MPDNDGKEIEKSQPTAGQALAAIGGAAAGGAGIGAIVAGPFGALIGAGAGAIAGGAGVIVYAVRNRNKLKKE